MPHIFSVFLNKPLLWPSICISDEVCGDSPLGPVLHNIGRCWPAPPFWDSWFGFIFVCNVREHFPGRISSLWALPKSPPSPLHAIWATFSLLKRCQDQFGQGAPPPSPSRILAMPKRKGVFVWEIIPNSKLCWLFDLIFGQCKLLPAIQFGSPPGKGGVRAFISMTPAQVALDLIPFKRSGYFTICPHTEVCWAS